MATGLLCLLLGFLSGGCVMGAAYEKKIREGKPFVVDGQVYTAERKDIVTGNE